MSGFSDFIKRLSCRSQCALNEHAVIIETGNVLDLTQYQLTMKDVRDLNRIASKRKIKIDDEEPKISEV